VRLPYETPQGYQYFPHLKLRPGNGSTRYIGACSASDYECGQIYGRPGQILESIGGRVVEKEVEFFVKDNGLGDPAYHEKIFILFIEPKRSKQKGWGAGYRQDDDLLKPARFGLKVKKGKGSTFLI
jgi:hypothetical protein